MSLQTSFWILALHAVGFVLWLSGLWAGVWLLGVHGRVEAASRSVLVGVERKVGIFMDAGATLAIVAGLVLALGRTPNAFKTGGWLHIKLTLVVVGILSVHGVVRVKMKKHRNGDMTPLGAWVVPVLFVAMIGVIALGANKMLLRGG